MTVADILKRQDHSDGSATMLLGTDSDAFAQRLKQAANGHKVTETPTPEGEGQSTHDRDGGGPVTRFTNAFAPLGLGTLEYVGLSGHEIADAIQMRVTELYRNEFPVIQPRFERRCVECEAEFEERHEECPQCGGETREPDADERQRFETMLERVNREGQSFRELAKALEFDQGFLGCPVLVIRYDYTIAGRDSPVSRRGEVIDRDPVELVKGDPKKIVPVVDENRRIGGYWWACPRCRGHPDYEPAREPDHCADCGARLKEVYFAEYGERRTSEEIQTYYFEDEVLTFPWYFPRLNGLDGLTPVHHVWLKQVIIEYMDSYAGSFYDPESDRLPNQFIVLHTTNPDAWEARLDQARENAEEDRYDSPIFANEYSPQDASTPEVQVVDAMPDELLGQNETLKDTLKKDIRQAFNIADVFDSDLGEAGGLNNEGLQLEVTDRSIATQMHDYATGWLDELAKRLGVDDWTLGFIPSAGPDAEDLLAEVKAGKLAEESGLDARMVGGQAEVADGPFDVPEPEAGGPGAPDAGGGGGPDPFQFADGGSGNLNRGLTQKQEAVPDNAIRVPGPDEIPDSAADSGQGPQGGWWYVPGDEDGADTDEGDGDFGSSPEFSDTPPDSVDVSQATGSASLSESGLPDGNTKQHINIVETADGNTVFVKDFSDIAEVVADGGWTGTVEDDMLNTEMGSAVTRALGGATTTNWYDEENQAMLSEGVENPSGGLEDEAFNDDDLVDTTAAGILTGNSDLHYRQFVVDDDGTPVLTDHDHAGKTLEDSKVLRKAFSPKGPMLWSDERDNEDVWTRAKEMVEENDIDAIADDLEANGMPGHAESLRANAEFVANTDFEDLDV